MSETKAVPKRKREPEPKICFLSMASPEQVLCARHECAAWNTNKKYPGCALLQNLQNMSLNIYAIMQALRGGKNPY